MLTSHFHTEGWISESSPSALSLVNEVVVLLVTPLEAVLFQYLPELVVAFETENLTGERRDLGLHVGLPLFGFCEVGVDSTRVCESVTCPLALTALP